MECDKDEYQCSVSLCTAYDPVNITPTTFLYDRNTAETWVEKNPRNSTIPQTRRPFVVSDITPNVALRTEMRQYFQDLMGSEYTGWEVIPDYPQLLSLPDIIECLAQVRQYFPEEEAEVRQMRPETWSDAWKRLNYLRLNLQTSPENRQHFLSDEEPIRCFAEIIAHSYALDAKSEESNLFHREVLRTIRALDLITHPLRDHLMPRDVSECDRFRGFLLRNLLLYDEGLLPIILDLLALAAYTIVDHDEVYRILVYILKIHPTPLSSTDLRNLARILNGFCSFSNVFFNTTAGVMGLRKTILRAFLQILIYTMGNFKNEDDRIGIVEDAYEAIELSLSWLRELLRFPEESQEVFLAYAIENNLLMHIHEMITMTIERQSVHWSNLPAEHWLTALDIAKIFFENVGSADLMTENKFQLYQSLLCAPIPGRPYHSHFLKRCLGEILQMFRDFVDIHESTASINEK